MNSTQTKITVSKILIVDDNADTRRMTRFFLRDFQIEFDECADGSEAIVCYEAFRPDWVLMDWEMKRMNGLQATRCIIEKYPQAKIFIVTQYDDDDLRDAATDAGARGFVLKDDLQTLRSLLIRK